METSPKVIKIERVDDIPLLLAQIQKMKIPSLLNTHFPTHGNWQGPSLGEVSAVWLSHILSEGDHRLNSVQDWAGARLGILQSCLGVPDLRELDFSDDRLSQMLDYLGGDDAAWEDYERTQFATLLRVYDLKSSRVRIDSTTAKSHVGVEPDGLFQLGHSKEHRPDLPQLKINQATLDPLGMPLTMTIVSGERADDPLYVPEIRKVQNCLEHHGVLYVGDCKMAALPTRAYVAGSQDYYLCPLPAVQMPALELQALLAPVWTGQQTLTPVHRASQATPDTMEHIAEGFTYQITLEVGDVQWKETRLVVHSFKHAHAKQKALDNRIEKAQKEIESLNQRGRGRKHLDLEQTQTEVQAILKSREVTDILDVQYVVQTQTTTKRAYRGKAAQEETRVDVTVQTKRRDTAYEECVRTLGWRVFACNDPELTLEEAVLAYREEYLIERGFNRLRGKTLGMTPLYLSSTTRIKGLIRLLCIGLRVLCIVEFTVREALRKRVEKLANIYAGNPKRSTTKPTTEMMLRAFTGINTVEINLGETSWHSVTPLNTVQSRILDLLGLPATIYQGLNRKSEELALEISEP
jgi:transposase